MSKTLNLVNHLMDTSRTMRAQGREHDATQLLTRLSRFQDLPSAISEEMQTRLAESYLEQRKYRKARRFLTAALSNHPNSARHHYLMARAFAEPDSGDSQRAADHYRKSLEIDPDQPNCLSDFGLLCLTMGQIDAGLERLRRAVELSPHDPRMLQNLVDGLEEVDQLDEVRHVLQAALFRNSRDARFRHMWENFQFQLLWRKQQEHSGTNDGDHSQAVLPFVRPALKIVRHDAPAALDSPHSSRGAGISRRQVR